MDPQPLKTFTSKHGFTVHWLMVTNPETQKQTIRIRFCGISGRMIEDDLFEIGDEINAQKKFDAQVAILKEWEEME